MKFARAKLINITKSKLYYLKKKQRITTYLTKNVLFAVNLPMEKNNVKSVLEKQKNIWTVWIKMQLYPKIEIIITI